MNKVNAAVDDFRQKQAASQDEAIYHDADPALRQSTTLADLVHSDALARAALSHACQAPHESGWNMNYGTEGQVVTLSYSRTCATGDLDEVFRFRFASGTPHLLAYNISGMAFLNAMQPTDQTPSAMSPDTSKPAPATPPPAPPKPPATPT